MHRFDELASRCAAFTLGALNKANEQTIVELQSSAATPLIKALQMIRLQKVILAVGMFSIFEASLQRRLNLEGGHAFKKAQAILDQIGEKALSRRFIDLESAINVLKHGKGRSYNALVAKPEDLDFRMKRPGEHFFDEGDVSEIETLIEVDDAFVLFCGDVISEVSQMLSTYHSE